MRFTWDDNKRRENIHKHGFDSVDAPLIFDGPMLAQPDTRFDYGEDRWIAIGFLRNRVVVIVYVETVDAEVIRIISLRKALNHERKRFEQYLEN